MDLNRILTNYPQRVKCSHGENYTALFAGGYAGAGSSGWHRCLHGDSAARWVAMGMTSAEMLSVIANLKRHDFYKSMTTYRDHRVWQDVYHGRCPNGLTAYIKLTQVAERVVIQFKEK